MHSAAEQRCWAATDLEHVLAIGVLAHGGVALERAPQRAAIWQGASGETAREFLQHRHEARDDLLTT